MVGGGGGGGRGGKQVARLYKTGMLKRVSGPFLHFTSTRHSLDTLEKSEEVFMFRVKPLTVHFTRIEGLYEVEPNILNL